MKVRNGSLFSCRMLTRETNVKWWGWLVANCVSKRAAKVSNKSTKLGKSHEAMKGLPLWWSLEHPTKDYIVCGVEAYLGDVYVQVFV